LIESVILDFFRKLKCTVRRTTLSKHYYLACNSVYIIHLSGQHSWFVLFYSTYFTVYTYTFEYNDPEFLTKLEQAIINYRLVNEI